LNMKPAIIIPTQEGKIKIWKNIINGPSCAMPDLTFCDINICRSPI
jgi:hypothetical protein